MMQALPPAAWLLIWALEQCLKFFGITTTLWHAMVHHVRIWKWEIVTGLLLVKVTQGWYARVHTIRWTSLKLFPLALDIHILFQKAAQKKKFKMCSGFREDIC